MEALRDNLQTLLNLESRFAELVDPDKALADQTRVLAKNVASAILVIDEELQRQATRLRALEDAGAGAPAVPAPTAAAPAPGGVTHVDGQAGTAVDVAAATGLDVDPEAKPDAVVALGPDLGTEGPGT